MTTTVQQPTYVIVSSPTTASTRCLYLKHGRRGRGHDQYWTDDLDQAFRFHTLITPARTLDNISRRMRRQAFILDITAGLPVLESRYARYRQ